MQGYFSWLRNSMPFNDGFSEAWNGQCFVKWWVVLIAQRYFSAIFDEYTLMCLLIETWNTDVINWFYSFHFKLQNPVFLLLLAHFVEDYFTRKLYIQRINIILTFYFNKFPISCLLSKIPYKSKFLCYTKGKKITFLKIWLGNGQNCILNISEPHKEIGSTMHHYLE